MDRGGRATKLIAAVARQGRMLIGCACLWAGHLCSLLCDIEKDGISFPFSRCQENGVDCRRLLCPVT